MVDCGFPGMPADGAITLRGTTYGSTVHYSCSTGHSLVGQNTSVCQADGQWSNEPPSCEGEWSLNTLSPVHTTLIIGPVCEYPVVAIYHSQQQQAASSKTNYIDDM